MRITRAASKRAADARDREEKFCHNHEQSPLLRLPAELRNKIFEYALSGYECHFVHATTPYRVKTTWFHPGYMDWISYKGGLRKPAKHACALTQSCRQVRVETALLMFKLNVIVMRNLQILHLAYGILTTEQCRSIRTLRLHVNTSHDVDRLSQWRIPPEEANEELHDLQDLLGPLQADFTGLKDVTIGDATVGNTVMNMVIPMLDNHVDLPQEDKEKVIRVHVVVMPLDFDTRWYDRALFLNGKFFIWGRAPWPLRLVRCLYVTTVQGRKSQ